MKTVNVNSIVLLLNDIQCYARKIKRYSIMVQDKYGAVIMDDSDVIHNICDTIKDDLSNLNINSITDFKFDKSIIDIHKLRFKDICNEYGIAEVFSNKGDIFDSAHHFDKTILYVVPMKDNNRETILSLVSNELHSMFVPLYGNKFADKDYTENCNFKIEVVTKNELKYNDICFDDSLFLINI